MKKLLFTQVLLLLALCSQAQQVSVDEARTRAMNFLQSSRAHRAPVKGTNAATSSVELAYTSTRDTDQKVCFYVFNEGQNDGFVIVGGDESAEEILGYSKTGSFDYATAPDNFKWWLSQYKQQISVAMDNVDESTAKSRKAMRKTASITKTDIEPLLSTEWNQDDPYNSAIPSLGSGYTGNYALATGCVATAMAQIMKYYNYPTTGVGSSSYQMNWGDLGTFTYSANFGKTTYAWGNMTNTYSSSSSDEAKEAVATLMYHCGVSVNMKYGQIASGGSSASAESAAAAFCNYFRYNKAVRNEYRTYYSNDAWENMIYNELSKNRPILYSGQTTSNSGHAFVCDGYQASDNTFHMNWGWGGAYNCYCKLTGTDAIKPGGTGAGGAGEDDAYDQKQQAIINIIASEGGLETPDLRNYTGSIGIYDGSTSYSSYSYSHDGVSKVLTLTGNVWNLSRTLTSFYLGVKATDTTTGLEYYWPNSSATELASTAYDDYSVTFDVNDLPYNGTYEIRMVGRNVNSTSNDDWYDVACATVPTVVVSDATDPTKTDVTMSVASNSVQVSRTLQIEHNSSYKGAITYESNNPDVATVDANGVITGVAEGTTTITAIAAGNTYFNETTKTFNITVTKLIKEDVDAEISATELVTGGTAQITLSNGYNGTAVYSTSNKSVATVTNGVITAGSTTGSATITITIPETNHYNAKTVTYDVNVNGTALILSKTPYISYSDDLSEITLHMPLYNGSATAFADNFYALIMFHNGSGVNYELGYNGSGLPSGTYNDYTLDLSSYKETLASGNDTKCTISFYHGTNQSNPFNIPSITYTYLNTCGTISSGKFSTIILPMDVTTLPSGMQVFTCESENNGTLQLEEQTSIKKNTPYITYYTGSDAYTFYNYAGSNDLSTVKQGLLTGMLQAATVPAGSYVLQTNKDTNVQAFYYVNTAATGKANRCYVTLPASTTPTTTKALYFNENDGEETAISALSALTNGEMEAIYTANGTKVSSLQKGMNIVKMKDGSVRKIMVK